MLDNNGMVLGDNLYPDLDSGNFHFCLLIICKKIADLLLFAGVNTIIPTILVMSLISVLRICVTLQNKSNL